MSDNIANILPSFAFVMIPFSPTIAFNEITDKINKTTMVITNATSVIPLFFDIFLHKCYFQNDFYFFSFVNFLQI